MNDSDSPLVPRWTVTCPSWVALHGITHSFLQLRKLFQHDKAVIHEKAQIGTSELKSGVPGVLFQAADII